MPTYEMPFLLRIMNKKSTVASLRKAADLIFAQGGIIRKVESWGSKELPCRTSSHGKKYWEANHFYFCFDMPAKNVTDLKIEYRLNTDIIKSKVFKLEEPQSGECTFHEEMLPVPYRPDVKRLTEMMNDKGKKKKGFQYNSGLSYYPFQR